MILNIATTDSQRRRYNIEMQVDRDVAFIPRALFYLDSLYISQLAGGVDFSSFRKTIGISFLGFVVFPVYSKVHSRYYYRELDDGFVLTDIKELYFLELPEFHSESVKKLSIPPERWLNILKFSVKYVTIAVEIPADLSAEELST